MHEPLFAIEKLEALCGRDPAQAAMLDDLVRRLIEVLPADLAKAEQAWRSGAHEQAAATLHATRGAVAKLGAQRFASAARELQQMLKQAGTSEAALQAGFAELHVLAEATLARAYAWLTARHPS